MSDAFEGINQVTVDSVGWVSKTLFPILLSSEILARKRCAGNAFNVNVVCNIFFSKQFIQ